MGFLAAFPLFAAVWLHPTRETVHQFRDADQAKSHGWTIILPENSYIVKSLWFSVLCGQLALHPPRQQQGPPQQGRVLLARFTPQPTPDRRLQVVRIQESPEAGVALANLLPQAPGLETAEGVQEVGAQIGLAAAPANARRQAAR